MSLKVTAKVARSGKLTNILSRLRGLDRGPTSVQVGFPAGEVDADIVARATFNEYGTKHIPERPFLRNAMRGNRDKYQRAMGEGAREIFRAVWRSRDPVAVKRSVLYRLGVMAQGDVQAEITSLSSPPNAPSTVRQKGSSNPLIDTGEMRAAVSWKVD